ncbi:MAG: hypothetical protein P1V51_03085 [Deltaproteobacteria bacterium]|nr:hypothetical protein [Deltaproteobacteria bacterium]
MSESENGGSKGGAGPDKMKQQLDRMVKTTVEGLEELKEVLLRASQNAKVKLDATLLRRERDRLYQTLGEQTYHLVEDGTLKAPGALRDTIDRIHALVEQLAAEEASMDEGEGGPDDEETDS